MSGLQSPQPKSTARSESKIAIEPAGGPHLRVIAADPDVEAAPLEQFNTALAGGDLSRARDALLRFRDEQATERGRLQHEKAQLVQAVEDLQQLLDDRCHAHEEELRQQKDRLVSWNEHEKQALAAEAEKAMSEIQSAQDEFDEHCEQWETERDEQSTLLVEERTRLDHTAAELANRQAEFEVAMAQEQQERLRMADEMISQRESEWAER
ncbi:MAG: hypothetical protein H8E37_04115, partial [Planctomycetes bacterium]|nr:hypothetical protein [Planctomycetota bacterium]